MTATPVALHLSSWRVADLPVRGGAFFASLYLYVWLWVNPALLYSWPTPAFPAFLTARSFLTGFLRYPGGLAEYAAAALSQFFYHPWAGAVVIATVAGLLCVAAWALHAALSGSSPRLVHFVPAIVVAVAYGHYTHVLAPALALVAAAWLACAYALLPVRNGVVRLVVFLALSAALYHAAGGAYVVFALLCSVFELAAGRRVALGLLYAGCAAALPYAAGTYLFHVRPSASFSHVGLFRDAPDAVSRSLPLCLFAFFPLAAAGAAARARFRKWPVGGEVEAAGGEAARRPRLRWALETCGLFAVAGALAYGLSNGPARAVRQVEYYAGREMWPQVLEAAQQVRAERYGLLTNMTVNWALYRTGRLSSDLFAYRQGPLGLVANPNEFFPEDPEQPRAATALEFMRDSDILFELGRVSEAEHMATEALEDQGYRPAVVRRLAMAKMVKGEPEAARTFLTALSQDLVWGGWAEDRLRELEADRSFSSDPIVQRIRTLMIVRDDVGPRTVEAVMLELLERNRRNRMAFEYLMAHYLLTGNLEGIARDVSRLADFDYAGIPRHYEEALLLYGQLTGKMADLGGRSISTEARRQFREFNRLLRQPPGDRQAALRALAEGYRGSYLPYYVFFLGTESAQ